MDPWKILGVDRNATKEQIQKAYREKARKHHPDHGGDAWAFQQVQEAYQNIQNPYQPPAKNQNEEPAQSADAKLADENVDSEMAAPATDRAESRSLIEFFTGELPLQNETTIFILANCLDIFVTYMLLRFGRMPGSRFRAIESNPFANFFFELWGFNGMIAFKLFIVGFVCIIAQIVATKSMKRARFLLHAGTVLVALVVVYSLMLFAMHYR